MVNEKKCIIWGTPVSSIKANDIRNDHKHIIDSPRAGGKYEISHEASLGIRDVISLNNKEKIRLSGYIAKQNLIGRTPSLDLIMEGKNWLEKLPPIPANPIERAYLLLEGFVKESGDDIGKIFYYKDILNNSDKNNFGDYTFLYLFLALKQKKKCYFF